MRLHVSCWVAGDGSDRETGGREVRKSCLSKWEKILGTVPYPGRHVQNCALHQDPDQHPGCLPSHAQPGGFNPGSSPGDERG